MCKFNLRNFDTVIYTEEHTQEVRYRYSIEDSPGLLEIFLTIPEEADPVEYFVLHLKDLYRGYRDYTCYHGKWKYRLDLDKDVWRDGCCDEWYLSKIKMY